MNRFFIAGDMGGTKTLLALMKYNGDVRRPIKIKRYSSGSFADPAEVLMDFLSCCRALPKMAVIGVAGIVSDNTFVSPNIGWRADGDSVAEEVGIERCLFLNDLEAAAYGFSALVREDFVPLAKTQGREQERRGSSMSLILSAGTGLGAAATVSFSQVDGVVLATESGHASFAPFDSRTERLLRFMRLHGDASHVSVEDVCSGRGIANLYRFCLMEHGLPSCDVLSRNECDLVPEIVRQGIAASSPVCEATLQLFLDILASEAGNMALRFLAAGGIFLGGGIVPRLVECLDKKRFMDIFCRKGKMRGWLKDVPVSVIMDERLSLYGAAIKGMSMIDGIVKNLD